MKHFKPLKNLIPAALALSLLAGCGGTAAEDPAPTEEVEGVAIGAPLAEGYAADRVFSLNYDSSQPINPVTTTSTTNLLFSTLLYETPFVVAQDYSFTPSRLIENYSTTDGGLTWVFTVNNDVLFSDGAHLTARDVAYSIRRAMRTARFGGRLDNYNVVYGVSALNDASFMVTLYKANLQFPALLTIPVIKDGEANVNVPVGTGLYKLMDVPGMLTDEDEDIEAEATPAPVGEPRMEVNTLHPDAAGAPLDVIYLKEYPDPESAITAFEDSLLDLVENDPTGISNLGYGSANELRSFVGPSMHFLGFNMTKEFVLTAQYRYALSYAIDRDYITETLMVGNAVSAVSPIVPTSPLYDSSSDTVFRFSTENCLSALERGGCADHDEDGLLEYMVTGIPMEINIDFIVNNENSLKVSAARKIAQDLTDIGITVTLRELTWNEFTTALEEGDFDMYYGEVRLTADFDLSRLLSEEGSLNYGGVVDVGYANRIDAYLAAEEDARAAACADMCQYILSNAPIIPIAFERQDVITHRGVVTGMVLSPYDIFYNFKDWTIDLN